MASKCPTVRFTLCSDRLPDVSGIFLVATPFAYNPALCEDAIVYYGPGRDGAMRWQPLGDGELRVEVLAWIGPIERLSASRITARAAEVLFDV
jgi:hypothetical protein